LCGDKRKGLTGTNERSERVSERGEREMSAREVNGEPSSDPRVGVIPHPVVHPTLPVRHLLIHPVSV